MIVIKTRFINSLFDNRGSVPTSLRNIIVPVPMTCAITSLYGIRELVHVPAGLQDIISPLLVACCIASLRRMWGSVLANLRDIIIPLLVTYFIFSLWRIPCSVLASVWDIIIPLLMEYFTTSVTEDFALVPGGPLVIFVYRKVLCFIAFPNCDPVLV